MDFNFTFFQSFSLIFKRTWKKDRCINIQHKFGNITIVYNFYNHIENTYGILERGGGGRGGGCDLCQQETSQQPRNALIYSASKKVENMTKHTCLKGSSRRRSTSVLSTQQSVLYTSVCFVDSKRFFFHLYFVFVFLFFFFFF